MTTPDRFIDGYRAFHQRYFHDNPALYERLQHEQQPKSMIISCSDSRVDPAMILGADAGDVFVVRNVANIVPPFAAGSANSIGSAAEFACNVLKVEHIIVLGHAGCGGIEALVNGSAQDSLCIHPWLNLAQDVLATAKHRLTEAKAENLQQAAEQANILASVDNLRTYPWIQASEDSGTIQLHGWYFDIVSGMLAVYDAPTDRFCPVGSS